MLFANFSKEQDLFQAKYKNAATLYKGKGLSFMFGDVDSTQNAFQVVIFSFTATFFSPLHLNVSDLIVFYVLSQYFGLKAEQAPLLIIQQADGQKYLKANIEPDQIESWLKDYVVLDTFLAMTLLRGLFQ